MDKNKNLLFIIAIVVLAVAACFPVHTALKSYMFNDFMFNYYSHQFIKESLSYGQFPHWIPYYFGGMPYFANAQSMVFSLSGILAVFLPTVAALHLGFILDMIIAGIGIYFLMLYLKIDRRFAFLSAIVFMFNGWSMFMVKGGGLERYNTYAWLPLVFLFCFKAIKEKRWFYYAAIAAIMIALAFYGAGLDTFLWIMVFVFLLFAYSLVGKNPKKRFVKVVLSGAIIIIVFFCLVAVKFLPLLEFNSFTNKAGGFSLEQSFGGKLSLKDAFLMPFVKTTETANYPIRVGFLAFALVLFSLTKIKNRKVLFFVLMALVNILICMSINLYYPLWKFVPGFKAQHDVTRSLFITVFACSALAGFGASSLFSKLKWKEKSKNVLWVVFIVVILLELVVFGLRNDATLNYFDEHIKNNHILQYMSEQEGVFRIDNIGTNAIGGAAGAYAVPLHLQILYGYNNVWITEYFNEYLAIAQRDPATFLGMLNTKYVYYNESINIPGFEFVKKFDECSFCYGDSTDHGVAGPYLYENKKYLPRAYIANNAILVAGSMDAVKQTAYALMLDPNFNPANTVIVMGGNGVITNYNIDFLKRFDVIVLTQGSVDANSELLLKNYADNGGMLIPDIADGINTITDNDIKLMWQKLKTNKSYENVKEVAVEYYSPNKIIFNVEDKNKFLVLSEKFFMFEGWKADIGQNSIDIYRANGINSALWIDRSGELVFTYNSKTFKKGMIITVIMIVALIGYLSYCRLHKNKK